MVKYLLSFISPHSSLSISQHNISLAYVASALAMFALMLPVRVLLMQQSLTNAQISILTGLIFFSVVLLELPTGAFADLVGKKITVILSYFVGSLAMLSYIWASSFWQFAMAVSLHGLHQSLKSGAHAALIFDSLAQDGRQSEFKVINSRLMAIVQFSMVAATFIGGWMGNINLTWPFIGYSVAFLLAAVLVLFMKEPGVDTEKFTLKNYLRQTIDGTKHLFQHKRITRLALLYMLVGGIGWTFQRLLREMIMIDVGFDQMEMGIILGAARLLNILLLVRLAKSVKASQKGWDILFLPLLMVFSYLPGIWLNKIISVPIVVGMMMIGTGRFLIYDPYLHHEIESRYRATTMSAANLLVSLLLAINMVGLGFFLDKINIPQVMIGYGLISLLLVVPLAFAVRRDFQDKNNDKIKL